MHGYKHLMRKPKKLAFTLVEASCNQVALQKDGSTIHIPPIPEGDEHFWTTVIYDLLRLGVDHETLIRRFWLYRHWTVENINRFIQEHGRKVWGTDTLFDILEV